jgi:hypothetical protein
VLEDKDGHKIVATLWLPKFEHPTAHETGDTSQSPDGTVYRSTGKRWVKLNSRIGAGEGGNYTRGDIALAEGAVFERGDVRREDGFVYSDNGKFKKTCVGAGEGGNYTRNDIALAEGAVFERGDVRGDGFRYDGRDFCSLLQAAADVLEGVDVFLEFMDGETPEDIFYMVDELVKPIVSEFGLPSSSSTSTTTSTSTPSPEPNALRFLCWADRIKKTDARVSFNNSKECKESLFKDTGVTAQMLKRAEEKLNPQLSNELVVALKSGITSQVEPKLREAAHKRVYEALGFRASDYTITFSELEAYKDPIECALFEAAGIQVLVESEGGLFENKCLNKKHGSARGAGSMVLDKGRRYYW